MFNELGQLRRSMCNTNNGVVSAVYRWEPKGFVYSIVQIDVSYFSFNLCP